MSLPSFVAFGELAGVLSQIKSYICPHCGKLGTFNLHDWEEQYIEGTLQVTGKRLFCSSRRKSNPGCGQTVLICIGEKIKNHTVCTRAMSRFLGCLAACANIHAAWLEARTGFSIDSAYRWAQRIEEYSIKLREILHRKEDPSFEKKKTRAHGLAELLDHLHRVYGRDDPLKSLQLTEQIAFLQS